MAKFSIKKRFKVLLCVVFFLFFFRFGFLFSICADLKPFLSRKESYRLFLECTGIVSTPKSNQNAKKKKIPVTPAAQLAISLVLADTPRVMFLRSAFSVGWVVFQ